MSASCAPSSEAYSFASRPNNVRYVDVNRLTPNDPYMGRTAPLTSKRCILYIYSTNILNMLYTLLFSLKMQFLS